MERQSRASLPKVPLPITCITTITMELLLTVTASAGLTATGWGQGVCVGDYDNDGWEDLYVTYSGKNRLYHNVGGRFEEVGETSWRGWHGKTWGSGCAFVDYDRDGHLDLMVANYADFDLLHAPAPGKYPTCLWKGIAVFCGPRGLPASKNILYRNLGRGAFRGRDQFFEDRPYHGPLLLQRLDARL